MALTALLQQGFGAKLTNHPPGQPLLELQGSPAKVNQVTLESSELLLTQLIPAYVHGVPMRINNVETAMHQLDDLHGGLLSGGCGGKARSGWGPNNVIKCPGSFQNDPRSF